MGATGRYTGFVPVVACCALFAWLGPANDASAQDDAWWEEEETSGGEEEETEGGDAEDEEADEEEQDGEDEDEDEEEQEEEEEEEESEGDDAPRTWFFGPYFRFVLVPAFIPQLFLDEAPTVANPAFGANATMRGETVNIVFGLGYTGYSFKDPFRAQGDPPEDTEWVESNLGLVHATASLLWDTDLSKMFAFEFGFGADLGIVTGELRRTEAYPTAGGGWAPCVAPLNPNPAYCQLPSVPYDEMGEHYDVVEERVPPVALVPMIPHLALRFTPATEWVVKAEMAYGIVQFWWGISAAYGPKL